LRDKSKKAARVGSLIQLIFYFHYSGLSEIQCHDFSLCFVEVRLDRGLTSDFWAVFAKEFCKLKQMQEDLVQNVESSGFLFADGIRTAVGRRGRCDTEGTDG